MRSGLIGRAAILGLTALVASNGALGVAAARASKLPPCPSATATGCDKSGLQKVGVRSSQACKGKGPRTITASPIAPKDILYIQPMGLMTGGHVTPIDHGYFYIKGAQAAPPSQAAVYAPFDGNVSFVTRDVRNGDPRNTAAGSTYNDYALTIEATCTFRMHFSNLVSFTGGLERAVGALAANSKATPNYTVKSGELIGYTGLPTAYGIDVALENDDLTLKGFVRRAQYKESWKTHIADIFHFMKQPLKSQLLALDERDAKPRWGKIDYDIDGKLVGNWFRLGSGGYTGLQHGAEGYWDGHLAVVYDGNDPTQIEVSFGSYQGSPQQFAVVGNAPDPATVGVATGVVKYELGQIERYSADSGAPWDNMHYVPHIRARAGTDVNGTVLLQMVGKRSLKMEIFPGKRAAAVSGFDAGALMYER
jgi:hypothetical protein